jgi:hypothetical protein
MFCQAGDPPALQVHLDLATSGEGQTFTRVFRPHPSYQSSSLVQSNGDMDFRRYNQSIEVVINLVDDSGSHRHFFDGVAPDGVRYHVFAYSDEPDERGPLEPVAFDHHQFRNIVLSNNGTTVSFCYHNDDRGSKKEAPGSHVRVRYGVYLGDDQHQDAPFLVHPIISNGANHNAVLPLKQ